MKKICAIWRSVYLMLCVKETRLAIRKRWIFNYCQAAQIEGVGDLAQGYFIHRPMPFTDANSWLDKAYSTVAAGLLIRSLRSRIATATARHD